MAPTRSQLKLGLSVSGRATHFGQDSPRTAHAGNENHGREMEVEQKLTQLE